MCRLVEAVQRWERQLDVLRYAVGFPAGFHSAGDCCKATVWSSQMDRRFPDSLIRRLWDILEVARGSDFKKSGVVKSLIECLDNVSTKLAERLSGDLAASLEELRRKIRASASTFKELAKRIHPDVVGPKPHELYIALQQENQRRNKLRN